VSALNEGEQPAPPPAQSEREWKWCPDCEGTERHGDKSRCTHSWHFTTAARSGSIDVESAEPDDDNCECGAGMCEVGANHDVSCGIHDCNDPECECNQPASQAAAAPEPKPATPEPQGGMGPTEALREQLIDGLKRCDTFEDLAEHLEQAR
jgi:hypothetical protein